MLHYIPVLFFTIVRNKLMSSNTYIKKLKKEIIFQLKPKDRLRKERKDQPEKICQRKK